MQRRVYGNFLEAIAAASACVSLIGCSVLGVAPGAPSIHLRGTIRGGQQPVMGSAIQLYAAGNTGDGSSALALLHTAVTSSDGTGNATDSNANAGNGFNSLPTGGFTITNDYQCPSGSTEVYLVAVGGNPGLPAGMTNPNLALMAALGPCSALSGTTNVSVNELTTVASVAALASFTTGYNSVGSDPSDNGSLVQAFAQVNELVDTSTGAVPGPALPSGFIAPTATLTTLADIIAACVNSAGGVAGDHSVCGNLFAFTTPPGQAPPPRTRSLQLST